MPRGSSTFALTRWLNNVRTVAGVTATELKADRSNSGNMGAMAAADDPAAPLRLLVGREVSAVCFVRDYVELHFDGPILRALANPFGLYGCRGWRFPEGQSPTLMRYYIGKVIDAYELVPNRYLAVDSGEHRFAIPLDDDSRTGPEAAHLIGVDEHDQTNTRTMWIW